MWMLFSKELDAEQHFEEIGTLFESIVQSQW